MSEKKIVVPDEMLKEALAHVDVSDLYGYDRVEATKSVVKAALLWQRKELGKSCDISPLLGGTFQDGWIAAWKHVHRMYDAPELEVPEEIKDLLLPNIESGFFKPEIVNERMAECFRRGQKAVKK